MINRRLTVILAVACGLMVANLYYAQALIGSIAPALAISPGQAGLIVTVTQIGYGAGLLLIVSLADIVENRRLILTLVAGSACGLVGILLSPNAACFLAFSFLTGLCSVAAQVMVPLAAHLAPEESRGRVVGNVMGGLLTGIMLARPLASGLAAFGSWRMIFGVAAILMVLLGLLLARDLPVRRPATRMSYGRIIASSILALVRTPSVRRRAAYQVALFGTFNLFWTAVPLLLAQRFGLGEIGIALFALAGAGGALSAPFAGRLGDRGYIRAGTAAALIGTIIAFLVADLANAWSTLAMLVVAALLLDASVQINQVLGQRVIYSVAADMRGRINASYMTASFIGGATGSALAPYALVRGGWSATTLIGASIAAAAFLFFLTEFRPTRANTPASRP